ncbi:hypothetical protein PRIC1_001412 [Phytophthora ramorum]|uniref:RxLR effector protein n=1 Tax=Phytophthora ramorum TaxID=164328 RepID=H3GD56_PHYRM|nr:hypothetical protein KRP23_9983 [Phytophthora ramorum]
MRLAQVVLTTLVVLLSIVGNFAATTATTNEIASTGSSTLKTTKVNATTSRIEITSKNATATIASLRQFLAIQLLNRTSTAAEERAVSTSGAGARIGAGGTVVSTSTSGGKTVTVTIYNNNGLLQKIQRWWKKLFGGSSSTRRLRQPTMP